MCTVLKQYLNQNPENPLNERKNSTMTSPVLMHYYIPPSKIQGAQQNNAGEISIIVICVKIKILESMRWKGPSWPVHYIISRKTNSKFKRIFETNLDV